ncbi:zinc finger protein GLIS2 homolog isoform X1 [Anoplophora glabripennis]|uniref:zinc finger protein GLIS2 homolog isoform X1 n=1 Tax=Anoplophora glabripennis TaxID=217634 RepID=UPI000873F520|nr:zinc finger protein GLIS2 homolog isoform X1 [Anoplophora glabripennis]
MIVSSNHRMVEGQPLQYYNPYPAPSQDQFPYFRPFEPYYPRMEMSEDLMLPSSPNSAQSDSDNSVSSVEISPKQIQPMSSIIKNAEKIDVRCCWKNCGMFFPSLDQLASHVSKVHSASGLGGLFYCGWEGCSRNNKGFNARYKMLVHVRTHTNEKPHKCFQCDKSFSRAENLKIHSRSHSGEKPYVCPVPGCNKAYSNSSDRFKHTRTHQVEKPYQCKVPGCPKRYTDPSSLRKHVKTYKHFVNENIENNQTNDQRKDNNNTHINKTSEVNSGKNEERVSIYTPNGETIYRENVIKHPCNCNRVCCVSNCFTKAGDIFRIGALINMKNEEKSLSWNRFLDPYISEPKRMVSAYEVGNQENMDIDVPLDLSIHRKDY